MIHSTRISFLCSKPRLKNKKRSSHWGSVVTNPTSISEDAGSIPGFHQWVKDLVLLLNCGVRHWHGSGLALLWLWCRQAAEALTWPLAWKLTYATGVGLKKTKNKIKNKNDLVKNDNTQTSQEKLQVAKGPCEIFSRLLCVWIWLPEGEMMNVYLTTLEQGLCRRREESQVHFTHCGAFYKTMN